MKFAAAIALFCNQALAESSVIFRYGERNNLDENNNFRHPFLEQSNVDVIAYPDIGAFSLRLTEIQNSNASTPQDPPNLNVGFAIADTFLTLTNSQNSFYTAPLYLGGSLTKFTVLYDTGSPELALGVTGCTGCAGLKYNYSASGTFSWVANSDRTISYADGTTFTGTRAKEKICPINNATSCISNFQFLGIKTATNDNSGGKFDGIMGLGRHGTWYTG